MENSLISLDYMKLLFEIRKTIIPKLESAEGFDFSIDWRSQDFKQVGFINCSFIRYQVIYTTKELMKLRKSNNFKAPVEKLVPINYTDKRSTYGSTHSSKNHNSTFLQNVNSGQHHSNTTCSYSLSAAPSEVNSVYFVHENPSRSQSQCIVSKSISDLRSTRANSQQQDYIPLNNRVLHTDSGLDRDESDFPENPTKSSEETFHEDNFIGHSKSPSISKISDNGQPDNPTPSLISAISHKNSAYSISNDPYDNFLIEKVSLDEKKNSQDLAHVTLSSITSNPGQKNYDLPLS